MIVRQLLFLIMIAILVKFNNEYVFVCWRTPVWITTPDDNFIYLVEHFALCVAVAETDVRVVLGFPTSVEHVYRAVNVAA